MTAPTFSICIPNYNYARYIGETIQSVLDQTYPHFEIIIADNASTDNSVEVIESFKDKRIRLIRNRYNIGFAPNLQRVASEAQNDFLILLSSDDRMRPKALEIYSAVIKSQGQEAPRTVLYSVAAMIDGSGQQLPHNVDQQIFYQELPVTERPLLDGGTYYLYNGRDVLRKVLGHLGPAGPFLTMAYPRRLFEAVEGYNSVHLTDPDAHFTHKILAQNPLVAWIREPLFEYRVHNRSQLAQQGKQASIKKPIDKYLYTLEVPESQLESLGLTRQDLIRVFVNKYCVNEMFHYLARGHYQQALKGLAFAMTTYPKQTLRTPRAYGLAGLLLLGPLAAPSTRLARDWYRRLGGAD